jgi:hypothetical protein
MTTNTVFQLRRNSVSGTRPTTTTVAPGELAINTTDGILFSANASTIFEIGSNNTTVAVGNASSRFTVNTTAVVISNSQSLTANGSTGTAGQVLTSNGSGVYWGSTGGTGTVTSVATGNGLSGGPITTTGTISVVANNGIAANSTGVYVVQGTGTVVNASGVHVNTSFIGTLAANSASFLGGNSASDLRTYSEQLAGNAYSNAVANAAALYQTTSGLSANVATLTANAAVFLGNSSGTIANVASWITGNAATAYTNAITVASNATNLSTGTVATARLGSGTANSTTFLAGDQTYKTSVTSVSSGNGLAGGPITTTGTLSVQAGTGVTVNATGVHIGQAVGTTSSVTFGTLSVTGNTALGDATADIVSINGSVNTNIMPSANVTYGLGNTTMRWSQVHIANVHAVTGKFDGNVEIAGSLTVTGNVSNVSVTDLVVSDPLIHIGANNETSDLVDLGWVGHYSNDGGATRRHAGLFRDATDGTFKIFTNLVQADLDAANAITINTAAVSYSTGALQTFLLSGGLTTNGTTVAITANSTVNVAIVANTVSGAFTGNLTGNVTGTVSNATNLNSQPGSFYTNATNLSTGTVPTARLGSGTANSTTFLSGDQSYKTAVTSVATGSGLTGGTVTTTGTVSVLANNGITANATGVYVTQGTGTVVNATGVHVNSTFIGTLSANNASFLGGTAAASYQLNSTLAANVATLTANNSTNFNGQPATFYTNATNLSSGTVPTARLGSGTANSTTFLAGDQTYKTALTTAVTSVATGNGLTGGTITTTGTVSVVANSGIIANSTGVFVNGNTGIVSNSAGVFVNASYISTISANNASFLGGVAAASYQLNSTLSANVATLTSNNSTNLNGQPATFYTNATNLSTGTLPDARLSSAVVNTSGNFTITGTRVHNANVTVNSTFVVANSTANVAFFAANGNVGIGTSTPGAFTSNGISTGRLAVIGALGPQASIGTVRNGFVFNVNDVSSSQLLFESTSSPNLSIGTQHNTDLYFVANNIDSMTITAANNNVGIGVYPTARLDVGGGNVRVRGNLIANGAIQANGSLGTAGQVLTSNGTGVYWAAAAAGVNTAAQFAWTNTHTFAANLTILNTSELIIQSGAGIQANGSFGTVGQVLTSNGSSVHWANGVSAVVTQQFTANGTANSFTVSGGYIPSAIEVYVAGVKQIPNTDVTITSGSTVNFTVAPLNGQVVDVFGYRSVGGIVGPRVASITTATTITPTADTADQYNVTALATAATIAAPSGTPADGQRLILRFKDNGTGRALTWTTSSGAYRAVGPTLPTTTVATKTTYVGCVYNAADTFWDVIAVATQA